MVCSIFGHPRAAPATSAKAAAPRQRPRSTPLVGGRAVRAGMPHWGCRLAIQGRPVSRAAQALCSLDRDTCPKHVSRAAATHGGMRARPPTLGCMLRSASGWGNPAPAAPRAARPVIYSSPRAKPSAPAVGTGVPEVMPGVL